MLAAIGIGQADHQRFLHRGVPVEHCFDLAREHLEAADRDHVFEAIDDADETLVVDRADIAGAQPRSEEHTSELQSLMRISYAVFCLKKKKDEQYRYEQYRTRTS